MSRRLALLDLFLRRAMKPRLRATQSLAAADREFAAATRLLFPAPRGTRMTVRHVPGPARPVRVTRIAGPGVAEGPGLILHFHGGGYITGSAHSHRGLIARLSAAAGVAADAPDYRLAGEAPAPAAFEDALAVWDALMAEGRAPARIVLGGDSAGGGVALALLAALCARGTPPAGAYALSPWADLSLSGASVAANAEADPMLPADRIGEVAALILGPTPATDPRISPLFAAFPGAPPVALQSGQTEILHDDALRMAGILRRAGAAVTVDLWPDTPHVVQFFGDWLPEARDARARTAAFVRRCLQTDVPASR